MFVRNFMADRVVSVALDDSLQEAYDRMRSGQYDELPVLRADGQLAGILSMADLFRTVAEVGDFQAAMSRPVRTAMTERVYAVEADDLIETAARLMQEKDISGVPVVEGGQVKGFITQTDLIEALSVMMGVRSGTTRLTLLVPDRRGALARITEIIRDAGVNITHVATFESKLFHSYKVVVRVEADDPRPLIELLDQHGFKVIHCQED